MTTGIEVPPGAGVEWWQQRLDHDFPVGVIITWLGEAPRDSPQHVYHVPRIEVISMDGDNPFLYMPAPGWEKVISGQLTSYETQQDKPHLIVKAALDERPIEFSGAANSSEIAQMAPFREKWIAEADERGRSSFS